MLGFDQHGVSHVTESGDGTQGIGTCPFCGRESKFYFNKTEGTWDCKVCGRSGDFGKFLQCASAAYQSHVQDNGLLLQPLATSRGLKIGTFQAWGIGWSHKSQFFSIPVYGNNMGKMTDLRRYTLGRASMATRGTKSSLIRPTQLFDSKRVWLCEGEWDGMAMWECLRENNIDDDVLAVPGAGTLPLNCLELFRNKDVVLVFDNDEAGRNGELKAFNKLQGIAEKVRCVWWEVTQKTGFDLRDAYAEMGSAVYSHVLKLMHSHPRLAAPPVQDAPKKGPIAGDTAVEVLGYRDVFEAYKKWLYMQSSLVLDVMFGTVFANKILGDPLWVFLVAPPGGMKSELLMSLSGSPSVMCMTSLTPHALISGAAFAGGGDPSLIPKLDGKVLVIKDFTTILSMNTLGRDEIFGTLRDIYDGFTEKRFGNGVVRKYSSHFGILAGVTPAVETLGAANVTLGERFLKFKVPRCGPDRDVIARAVNNVSQDVGMRSDLCSIAKRVLAQTPSEDIVITRMHRSAIVEVAQWLAQMRGVVHREKYTGLLDFKPMTEVGTRIAKQLTKLALGISMYHNEKVVSETTMRAVFRVAIDTIPDRVEEIVRVMFILGEQGGSAGDIAKICRFPEDTVRHLLQDLNLLGIVRSAGTWPSVWRLEPRTLGMIQRLGIYTDEKIWFKAAMNLKEP